MINSRFASSSAPAGYRSPRTCSRSRCAGTLRYRLSYRDVEAGPCRVHRVFSSCIPSCKCSVRRGDGLSHTFQVVKPGWYRAHPRGLPRRSVRVSDLARRRRPSRVAADSTVRPWATSCLEPRRFRRSPLRVGPRGSPPLQRRHPRVMAARSMGGGLAVRSGPGQFAQPCPRVSPRGTLVVLP
jgi:hypothetical protein